MRITLVFQMRWAAGFSAQIALYEHVVRGYFNPGINRVRLESLLHRLFAEARLQITIHDRFGHPVQPEEWFLIPLHVIDEAVQRILDGSITKVAYDPKTACLYEVGTTLG